MNAGRRGAKGTNEHARVKIPDDIAHIRMAWDRRRLPTTKPLSEIQLVGPCECNAATCSVLAALANLYSSPHATVKKITSYIAKAELGRVHPQRATMRGDTIHHRNVIDLHRHQVRRNGDGGLLRRRQMIEMIESTVQHSSEGCNGKPLLILPRPSMMHEMR